MIPYFPNYVMEIKKVEKCTDEGSHYLMPIEESIWYKMPKLYDVKNNTKQNSEWKGYFSLA